MFFLDLFSGIGGFHLAAQMAGMEFEQTFYSEINEFSTKIYQQHFPASIALGDVTRINGRSLPKGEWVFTGGFPCQPFSIAGQQLGAKDPRYLWGAIMRLVSEVKPVWCIFENVPQIENVAFSVSEFEMGSIEGQKGIDSISELQLYRCCQDLEDKGYEVAVFAIPALAKNAPHRRMRVWIVAHRESFGRKSGESNGCGNIGKQEFSENEQQRCELRYQTERCPQSDTDSDQTSAINPISTGREINGSIPRNASNSNGENSTNGRAKSARRKKSGSSEIATSKSNSTGLERCGQKRGVTKIFSQNGIQFRFGDTSNGHSQRCQETQFRQQSNVDQSNNNFTDINGSRSVEERKNFAKWANHDRSNSHKWLEVATELCELDDGLSSGLDIARLRNDIAGRYPNATEKDIEKAIGKLVTRYRRERIESLGNAIVPQVAMEIFRVIKEIENA